MGCCTAKPTKEFDEDSESSPGVTADGEVIVDVDVSEVRTSVMLLLTHLLTTRRSGKRWGEGETSWRPRWWAWRAWRWAWAWFGQ